MVMMEGGSIEEDREKINLWNERREEWKERTRRRQGADGRLREGRAERDQLREG